MKAKTKTIPGFSRYMASIDGKIFSTVPYRDRWHECKQSLDKHGYPVVSIVADGGKRKSAKVHRLVMLAHENIEDSGILCVNHINGIKTDNNTANLEWCTQDENREHAIRTGLARHIRDVSPEPKINAEIAREIRRQYVPRVTPRHVLGTKYGLHKSHIDRILAGTSWPERSTQF